VDPADYPPLGHRRSRDVLQLVWVGSSSTLQGLQQARPLLEAVGRRVPGVALKLICDRFLELDALPVQPVRWKEETEKAEIADADVGISWVPDDLWSRGKCGLKVLQYMAAGLPVVANPVGVHTEMIAPGQTGFLAQTPQEWVEAIRRLAGDPLLRRRMGQAGRRRLEAEYSIAVGAARWRELLGRRIGADRLASTG
jgi:glycosyltransferase involved in cell wall biosynthesis